MTTTKADMKRNGDTETRTITSKLACKLTQEELVARGAELAEVLDDIKNEESSQVGLKKQMASTLASLEAKRDDLSSRVSRREEHRDVEVQETLDYKAGKFYRTRMDTGLVIFERPLTNDERQASLELAGS